VGLNLGVIPHHLQLVCWIAWVMVLLHGSDEQINEILQADIRLGRRLLLGLRTMSCRRRSWPV
jgi:hypothetical protein